MSKKSLRAALADSELVERLRDHESHCTSSGYHPPMNLLDRAADRIAALDDECQQSMLDIARERERAEMAEAQVAALTKRLDETMKVLEASREIVSWAHNCEDMTSRELLEQIDAVLAPKETEQ